MLIHLYSGTQAKTQVESSVRQRILHPTQVPTFANMLRIAVLGIVFCGILSSCSGTSNSTHTSRPTATPTALLPTPTPLADITYAAIGASDSFGTGTTDPAHDSWPAVLARGLGKSVHLLDLGIPGATAELAQRDEVPIAVAAQPKIITVLLGVNDIDDGISLSAFRTQLASILAVLESETPARVFVANLPDLTLFPHFASRDSLALLQEILQWNSTIAQVAREQGAILVDLYSDRAELAQHPEYIASDGLHPSTLGAMRVAAVFADVINASQTT